MNKVTWNKGDDTTKQTQKSDNKEGRTRRGKKKRKKGKTYIIR